MPGYAGLRKRLYGIEQDPMEIWSTQYAAMLEVLAAADVR